MSPVRKRLHLPGQHRTQRKSVQPASDSKYLRCNTLRSCRLLRRHLAAYLSCCLCLLRPAALVLFAHGLNLSEVFRAFFGGCFSATATEGNGGWIFLCHTRSLQKAVAVCKRELCINSNRLLLDAPFLLWGIFLLTVAEVRATHSRLEFRRFYKWRQMPYASIRQCAPSLHPGLGFIELNQFQSRIYFVTLRPTFDRSCDVVAYINERRLGPHVANAPHPCKEYHGAQRSNIKSIRLCLIMFLVGVIYSVCLTVWFPNLLSESNWNESPPWMSIPMILLLRAGSWPWALLTMAALIAWIIAMRFQKRAWAPAMVVGSLVGRLSMQLWR